ncbi:hypothetical protein G9E11_17065 [Arthrobacter sp. IA7]|uniref:hypothetical protein n=1 Tax=Arthrobacter ipis TaxID=2716202 RepID=UPI0016863819|nr:hypothetical protein [Arthrobacter ipis]MBD1543916.1 hypothetical protein [Arthrobacter ipis]
MTKTGNNETEAPAEKAAPAVAGLGLSAIQIIAGGAAAAVASVIGGHLGLAGTVIGAFILSVISAVALPLFRASLEKSHEQIKRVLPRRGTGATRITRPQIGLDTASIARATSGKVSAAALPLDQTRHREGDARAPSNLPRGRKAGMAIGGTAIIFLIGVGSILGIQSATGLALSSGTSALQSGITQVVSSAKDTKGSPATNPQPSAPTVAPSAVPTDSATDGATDPADQTTATPTQTSDPVQTAEQTPPAGADTPAPSSTLDPATGTSDGTSGAGGAGSQTQPDTGTSAGAVPAK